MGTYALNYVVEHATVDDSSATTIVNDGTTENYFNVYADYGYKFVATDGHENCPSITRIKNGVETTSYFASWDGSNLTDNYRRYTARLKVLDANLPPFVIKAIAQRNESVVFRTLDITNNVEGATPTYKQTGVSTFDMTLTGDSEGTFEVTPTITYTDAYGSSVTKKMTVSGNVAKLTITATDDAMTINGTFVPQTTTIPITYDVENVTLADMPTGINVGDTLVLEISANDGYEVESAYMTWIDVYGASNKVDGVISDDGVTAEITLEATSKMKSIAIKAIGVVIAPSVDYYGSINAYVVTKDQLGKFAKTRFRESTGYILTEIDLGDYVSRLKNIYVKIPDTYLNDDVLRCGNYNTGITCKSINNALLDFDFGTIELAPLYDSSFEYEHTELQLYLPFVGLVSVPNDIIGHEVGLTCTVNLVTGYGTYKFSDLSIGVDIPINITPFEPSSDILYNIGYDFNVIGGDKWNENQMISGEPQLIRKCARPQAKIIYDTYDTGTISSFPNGYVELKDIQMNTENIPSDIYDEIVRVLTNGFYKA